MKSVKQQGFWLVCLTFISLLATAAQAAPSREDEIKRYIDIFTNKSKVEQQQACERLPTTGLSDPRIFDLIEKNLLATYETANDRGEVNYSAWLAKGLGYSGQEKYRATLSTVAQNAKARNLKKYAEQALELLDQYKKWNPIINDQSQANPAKSAEVNRLANMIRSRDKALQNTAAQYIIEANVNDDWLFGVVQEAAEAEIGSTSLVTDGEVKAVAYMLKALAISGVPKYRTTVEKAANSAGSSKLQRYAKGYLKSY